MKGADIPKAAFLIFLVLCVAACSELSSVQFLTARGERENEISAVWERLLAQTSDLTMGCFPNLPKDQPPMLGQGKKASRELLCFWAKGNQKMYLLAAASRSVRVGQ